MSENTQRHRSPVRRFIDQINEDCMEIFHLVYFPDERKYSILKDGHRCLPKGFSGKTASNTPIDISHKGEIFGAIYIATGNEQDIQRKKRRLEARLDLSISINESVLGELEMTTSAVLEEEDTSPMMPTATPSVDDAPDQPFNVPLESLLSSIDAIKRTTQRMERSMVELHKEMRKLRKSVRLHTQTTEVMEHDVEPVIMFEDENLAAMSGKRPSLLGLKLATRVLGNEVLKKYRISPVKTTGRPPIPDEFFYKVAIIKKVVTSRFPNGWSEAKAAINQHGLDLSKKKA